MSLVLIDTSAWLFNFSPREVPRIRDRVAELVRKNLAAVTSPILFELLHGVPSGEEFGRWCRHLSSLHQFPLTEADWLKAAQWAQRLRSRGLKAKTVDFLIAYKAMRHRLVLLHADADFDRIARFVPLRVESCVRLARDWAG
ncbi:MAG: PIN domain-containing protein [Candidatus Omnitrophica bacterium]|nr:PIN domain-containing protein [Candidatus Omnitrophota bacterium]